MRVGLNADIRSTDPGVNRDDNTDTVMLHIVEGLVAHRENASVGPLLAEEVAVSKDGLTLHLQAAQGREIPQWRPADAADVHVELERYLDPKTQWRCLASSTAAAGPRSSVSPPPIRRPWCSRLDQPNGLFLASMARPDCGGGGILHTDSWRPTAAGRPRSAPVRSTWPNGNGRSTSSWRDSRTTRRRPAGAGWLHRRETGVVDEAASFMIIPDAPSAKAALLSGGSTAPDVTATATAQELKACRACSVGQPDMASCGLLFQTATRCSRNPQFARRSRMRWTCGQMVPALSNGLSEPNNSVNPADLPSRRCAAQGYTLRPRARQQAVKEGGYKGEPIKMLTNKRDRPMFDMALMRSDDAGRRHEYRDRNAGVGHPARALPSGNYQMMSFSYSAAAGPGAELRVDDRATKSKQPRKVWDNPQALALLREASAKSDAAKRQADLRRTAQEMLAGHCRW